MNYDRFDSQAFRLALKESLEVVEEQKRFDAYLRLNGTQHFRVSFPTGTIGEAPHCFEVAVMLGSWWIDYVEPEGVNINPSVQHEHTMLIATALKLGKDGQGLPNNRALLWPDDVLKLWRFKLETE